MSKLHSNRHPKFIDRTGHRYGRLTVECYEESPKTKGTFWWCVCDCGTRNLFRARDLASGNSKSCGCLKRESTIARSTKHGHSRRGQKTSEYIAWHSMIQRCCDATFTNYRDYGGRGIGVCKRWRESFANFIADMGLKPSRSYSIERIDNDGNYEPSNCRWATTREQGMNRRSNRRLTHDGLTLTLTEWAERLGIDPRTLWQRLKNGWTVKRAVTQPLCIVSRNRVYGTQT